MNDKERIEQKIFDITIFTWEEWNEIDVGIAQFYTVNERLGRIKRANSKPKMATETSYVSKEQPSIADDPTIKNAFYDAPTVITLFAPKNFLFATEDCAVAAENMMLVADSLGVGSCYIGAGWTVFADPYGQEILQKWGIRKDYYAVMQLLLGYPREEDNLVLCQDLVQVERGTNDTYFYDCVSFEVLHFTIYVSDETLGTALHRLTEKQRSAILLRYFQGMNDREISELYNVSRSAIFSRRSRGLKKLKMLLSERK